MAKNNNDILLIGGGLALFAVLAMSKKSGSASSNNSVNVPSSGNSNGIHIKSDGKPATFIKLVYPYAVQAHKVYPKVPIDLMITQGGLESQWGKSSPGNLLFGYKAGKGYAGQKQLLRTTEVLPKGSGYNFPEVISVTKMPSGKYHWVVKDWFRKYDTPLGAFLDYCKLLSSAHYANAFKTNDVYKIIEGIKAAGYATDPNYVPKLKNLVALVDKQIKAFA